MPWTRWLVSAPFFSAIALTALEPSHVRADELPSDATVEIAVIGRAKRYQDRYQLKDALDKRVDNQGEGDEALYGTRNLRAVIPGALYRGGANNHYHRSARRHNHNPLPGDGLENLCHEGFETTIYLYSTNFESAERSVSCEARETGDGARPNVNSYYQLSPFDGAEHRKTLELVYAALTDGSKGPVYAHCWNGWHASGFLAATALMQFCGLRPEAAVDYWNAGTDGNLHSQHYDEVRNAIGSFQPYPDLEISDELRQALCPDDAGRFAR